MISALVREREEDAEKTEVNCVTLVDTKYEQFYFILMNALKRTLSTMSQRKYTKIKKAKQKEEQNRNPW